MMGMRWKNQEISQQFFNVYDATVERTIFDRLFCVFGIQNWETQR